MMDEQDQEAVREILRRFRKAYRKNIDSIIAAILERIHHGQRVYEAVHDALADTQFWELNRQAILDAVYLAACAGYGVLPKIVLHPEKIKKKLLSDYWMPDKMPLSIRLHGTEEAMRRSIIDTIQSAMTMTKSVKEMAMALYDGYSSGNTVIHQADLPRYLDRLTTYARWAANGDQDMVQPVLEAAAKAQKLINTSSTPALKAAYKNLVQACKLFEPGAIDQAVHIALEEKSRYHAERIARTESARAWYEGYMAETKDDPDIWGYQYRLSSRHGLCPYDQCDVLAHANMGYGKGIYPKGKQPSLPRHPHCMCMLQAVYHWEVDQNQPFRPELAREYIDSASDRERQALFGIHGAQAYEAGEDWQKLLRGFDGFGDVPTRIRLGKEDFQLQLFADKQIEALGENKFSHGFSRNNLNRHFEKHASEFGDITKKQYASLALELIQKAVDNHKIFGYITNDGRIVRYDSVNNYFVSGNPNIGIATFMTLEQGKKRFDYLKNRDGKKDGD